MLGVLKPSTETNHEGGGGVNVCYGDTVCVCECVLWGHCKYGLKQHSVCVCVCVCVCASHMCVTATICVLGPLCLSACVKGTDVCRHTAFSGIFCVFSCALNSENAECYTDIFSGERHFNHF